MLHNVLQEMLTQTYKTAPDVIHCQLDVHPTPVIKYVTDTRRTEDKPHVILWAFRSRTEATQQPRKET